MGNRQKWYTNQMTANHLTKNRQSIFWILVPVHTHNKHIQITNTSNDPHKQIFFWFSWVILNRCEYHLHLKSIVIDSFLIFMTTPDNTRHVNNTERVGFEPTDSFSYQTISSRSLSTTQPPLLSKILNQNCIFY